MKRILGVLAILAIVFADTYGQTNSADSLAYQLQRRKINGMLAVRKQKFGEYDQSLSLHTGIFGLQTKKDIRHSNDILMDIVKTDDRIFIQLKILLDYTTFQQKQVQSHSVEADSSNIGFMTTINKLQAANERLKRQAEADEVERQKKAQIAMVIFIVLAVIILLLLRAKYSKTN